MTDEAAFMAQVEAISARDRRLTTLDAAVLAAVGLGIAPDSRTFARIFGVAHALALRAIADLADGYGLIAETARDPRTQRARLSLTDAGRAVFDVPAKIAA